MPSPAQAMGGSLASTPVPNRSLSATTRFRRTIWVSVWVAWVALVTACVSPTPKAPYPHESILTVIAELKIHLDRDPFGQAPGVDLAGHNIFRVSLARLDQLQELTPETYHDILAFARAQCLERLGQWEAAAGAMATAASYETELSEPARRRGDFAQSLARQVDRQSFSLALAGYLNDLEILGAELGEWIQEHAEWPYSAYGRVERERVRIEAARLLLANRLLLAEGPRRAIEAAERLIAENGDSHRLMEHWLLLGRIHETLARDWTVAYPPGGMAVNLDQGWNQWIGEARAAYQKVSRADGDPAKPEGRASLRALDAYALRIQTLAR